MSSPKVSFPFILINFKTYEEATGEKAITLASIVEKVSKSSGICIAIAPQNIDLFRVANVVDVPVFAQHVDPIGYGQYTGHIMPEAVIAAGGVGTLISHSERKLSLEVVGRTVERSDAVGLFQVVCVDSVGTGRATAPFGPDVIAIEPPELIGSGISVSKARPELVSEAVEAVQKVNPNVKVLCGAGITNGDDVTAAIRLGSEGVLVASGVVKAKDPFKKLEDLAGAML